MTDAPVADSPGTEDHRTSRRLFIALYPDEDIRRAIINAKGLQTITDFGRRVTVDNIHITVFFLGQVDGPLRSCVEQAVEGIRGRSFNLILDRLGYWSRPQILWLAPSRIPEELTSLYENMKSRLAKCGVTPDKRAYKPHLTLARKVKRPPPRIKIEPLSWHVKQFSLMESLPSPGGGVIYQELACWELD